MKVEWQKFASTAKKENTFSPSVCGTAKGEV